MKNLITEIKNKFPFNPKTDCPVNTVHHLDQIYFAVLEPLDPPGRRGFHLDIKT